MRFDWGETNFRPCNNPTVMPERQEIEHMSTTPNLGLTKPAIGSTGWGDDVNANWDKLDEIYTAPSSLERHVYPGDSIQDAIDEVGDIGGAIILHQGIHEFSTTLTITDGEYVSLIGRGQGTRLQYTGSGVAIDIVTDSNVCDDMTLRDFRLEATGGTKGTYGISINSDGPWAQYIIRVAARDFRTAGILLDGSQVYNIMIAGCNIANCEEGILADNLGRGRIIGNVFHLGGDDDYGIRLKNTSQYTRVIGNQVKGAATAGIMIEGSSTDIIVEGNTCHSGAGDGIKVDDSDRILVLGNIVEDYNGAGIKGSSGSSSLLISGNIVSNCTGDGIDLDNVDESSIVSNRCTSNGGYGISADASCDQNLYDGNHTRGNTTGGLSDSGTNSTTGTNK